MGETAKVIADCNGIDGMLVMLSAVQGAKRAIEAMRHQMEAIVDVGRKTDRALALVLQGGC